MSNVVVDPAYLNIGNMPAELRAQALNAIKDIPSIAYWPEGSYHKEEFEYQTGIDDIRRGLTATADTEQQATQWQYFLDYTNDLDRLRNTTTLEYIQEIKQYVSSR